MVSAGGPWPAAPWPHVRLAAVVVCLVLAAPRHASAAHSIDLTGNLSRCVAAGGPAIAVSACVQCGGPLCIARGFSLPGTQCLPQCSEFSAPGCLPAAPPRGNATLPLRNATLFVPGFTLMHMEHILMHLLPVFELALRLPAGPPPLLLLSIADTPRRKGRDLQTAYHALFRAFPGRLVLGHQVQEQCFARAVVGVHNGLASPDAVCEFQRRVARLPAFAVVLRPHRRAKCTEQPSGPPRRVLLVQRPRTRHVTNMDALVAIVRKGGGAPRVVQLEHLSMAEQVVAFHMSDVVVVPHGQGTSWMFMLQPGSYLLELSPGRAINMAGTTAFTALPAWHVGLGILVQSRRYWVKPIRNCNITIDPPNFAAAWEKVLAHRQSTCHYAKLSCRAFQLPTASLAGAVHPAAPLVHPRNTH